MSGWLYALGCVVIPAVWGVIMYFAFNLVDRRRGRQQPEPDLPPIDYSI